VLPHQDRPGKQEVHPPAVANRAGSPRSKPPTAGSRRPQRALERLREANEDMKRAGSQNSSAADSRRAADRLREATDALGHAQQQDASGRLNSMAQTAEQLAAQQKRQADRVRDLIAQQSAARTSGRQPNNPSAQEIDKMINDRQQVTDDLARLTSNCAVRRASSHLPNRRLLTSCGARSMAWMK